MTLLNEVFFSDELLLIEKFNFPPRDNSYLKNIKGPTVEEIMATTQHLPERNIVELPNTMECTENVSTEVYNLQFIVL